AAAVADGHLNAAEAFLPRAVVVVGERMAVGARRLGIGVYQRVLVARHLRHERAVAAAIGGGPALPALLAPEIGQDVRIGPVRQAVGGPAVVVAAIAADIG